MLDDVKCATYIESIPLLLSIQTKTISLAVQTHLNVELYRVCLDLDTILRELRIQRFYLTFCDILNVIHLNYWFFNSVPLKLTKNLYCYIKIVEYL